MLLPSEASGTRMAPHASELSLAEAFALLWLDDHGAFKMHSTSM